MKRIFSALLTMTMVVSLFFSVSPTKGVATTLTDYEVAKKYNDVSNNLIKMALSQSVTERQNFKQAAIDTLNDIIYDEDTSKADVATEQLNNTKSLNTAVLADREKIMTIATKCGKKAASLGSGREVFTTSSNIVTSNDMLDKNILQLTWPGTHNSYANSVDGNYSDGGFIDQGLGIANQMKYGIRWFDLDMGPHGSEIAFFHNIYLGGTTSVYQTLVKIRDFAKANPNTIVFFDWTDTPSAAAPYDSGWIYGKLRQTLYADGFVDYIYNMKRPNEHTGAASDVYTSAQWINPKLGDVLSSGRNIILYPFTDWMTKSKGAFQELGDGARVQADYKATKIEERSQYVQRFDEIKAGDAVPMILEVDPDEGAAGGQTVYDARNNDARRLYQAAKPYEYRKPINCLKVDNYLWTNVNGANGELDDASIQKSLVSAVNQLNKDRFGINYKGDYLVNMTPNNYGPDIIRNNSTIQSEIRTVIDNAANHSMNLSADSHKSGSITASDRRRLKIGSNQLNWWSVPELAFDGDYNTSWGTDGTSDYFTVDLGKSTTFNKVYIAWEFNFTRCGYTIYGSDNGVDWTPITSKEKITNTSLFFDENSFEQQKFRYIKFQTKDADNTYRNGVSEFFVYDTSASNSVFNATQKYKIVNKATGLQLDTLWKTGWNTVGQYLNSGDPGAWNVVSLADGYYKIKSYVNNEVLDGVGSAYLPVYMQADGYHLNLEWSIEKLADGYYKIKNKGNGMVLDGKGSTTNCDTVSTHPDVESANLEWSIIPIN